MEKQTFGLAKANSINEEERSLWATATSLTVDRDGEVVLPSAFKWPGGLKHYKKNPVVTWAHNWREPPVARAAEFAFTDKALDFKPVYAETARGEEIWQLYRGGFLNAFSIGFVPVAVDREPVLQGQTGVTHTKAELLEVACVVVPSNRDALVKAADQFDFAGKYVEALDSMLVKAGLFQEGGVVPDLDLEALGASEWPGGPGWEEFTGLFRSPYTITLDDMMVEGVIAKRVVPHKRFPLAPEDMSWRWNTAAQDAVLGDGNWQRYMSAHTYYNPAADEDNSPPQVKGAYKLPHHAIVEGALKTVWRGVAAAMTANLGGRGGVNVPAEERRGIYNHHVRHYREFDKEPPDFKDWDHQELLKWHYERFDLDLSPEMEALGLELREPYRADILGFNSLEAALVAFNAELSKVDQGGVQGQVLGTREREKLTQAVQALQALLEADQQCREGKDLAGAREALEGCIGELRSMRISDQVRSGIDELKGFTL